MLHEQEIRGQCSFRRIRVMWLSLLLCSTFSEGTRRLCARSGRSRVFGVISPSRREEGKADTRGVALGQSGVEVGDICSPKLMDT